METAEEFVDVLLPGTPRLRSALAPLIHRRDEAIRAAAKLEGKRELLASLREHAQPAYGIPVITVAVLDAYAAKYAEQLEGQGGT